MHVAGCMVFEGEPPSYDELVEQIACAAAPRAALPPAPRLRAVQPGPAGVGRRSALQHRLPRAPHGAAQPRRTRRSSSGWPGGSSRRRWTAPARCGRSGSSRALSDGRFALLSKTHHALVDGVSGVDIATVLFDTSPDPMPVAPPEHDWVPRPLPSGAQLLADALLERTTVPGARSCAGSGPPCAGRGMVAARLGRAAGGVDGDGARGSAGGPAEPAERPHRSTPAVHLGPGRPPAVQGDQERAGRDRQRRGPGRGGRRAGAVPADARRGHRGHRPARDGAHLGPRRGGARRPGQPRGRDVGAAADRHDRPGPAAADDQPGHGRDQGVRAGRRRPGAHRAHGLRPADDHGAGGTPAGPPAALQPRGHQRAGPSVPALHARPRARRDVPDGAPGREPGPRRSRS